MARYWVSSGTCMSSTALGLLPQCNHPNNIFRLPFFFFCVLLFFISTINWFVTSLESCRNVCIVCCVAGCHLCLPIWQFTGSGISGAQYEGLRANNDIALMANIWKWVPAIIGHAKRTYSKYVITTVKSLFDKW